MDTTISPTPAQQIGVAPVRKYITEELRGSKLLLDRALMITGVANCSDVFLGNGDIDISALSDKKVLLLFSVIMDMEDNLLREAHPEFVQLMQSKYRAARAAYWSVTAQQTK